ncbi:MAG: hypothetical protein ACOH5I_20510 [Oligoflexus sp.]
MILIIHLCTSQAARAQEIVELDTGWLIKAHYYEREGADWRLHHTDFISEKPIDQLIKMPATEKLVAEYVKVLPFEKITGEHTLWLRNPLGFVKVETNGKVTLKTRSNLPTVIGVCI